MAKAHPCIGGPLNGKFATSGDFHGDYQKVKGTNDYNLPMIPGMYAHLKDEYFQFNTANRAMAYRMNEHNKRIALAHVTWIHYSLLPASIHPRDR